MTAALVNLPPITYRGNNFYGALALVTVELGLIMVYLWLTSGRGDVDE